jgi:hypothetical protein
MMNLNIQDSLGIFKISKKKMEHNPQENKG